MSSEVPDIPSGPAATLGSIGIGIVVMWYVVEEVVELQPATPEQKSLPARVFRFQLVA